MRRLLLCFLLWSSILLSACHDRTPTEASAFALQTISLKVGSQTITAEVADTPETMQTGVMYRRSMPDDHGMIFVFPELRRATFWMHHTYLPLDIAYLDATGQIREIHAATPLDDTPIPSTTADIAYALEMNQGWFKKHGVPVGVTVQNLPKFPPSR